jgi:hypothetical protein
MLVLGFAFVISVVAATYAFFLRRGEVRRQEWRRESRASWLKN